MKRPLTDEEYANIYSKVTRLTVDLIVRMNKGIVLTLRTLKSWNNQWHLPGSAIRYKETISEAVHRVAKDELGIMVKIVKKIGNIEYPSEEKERGYGWSISIVVICDSRSDKLVLNDEASKVKVFESLPNILIKEQKVFLDQHWKEIF